MKNYDFNKSVTNVLKPIYENPSSLEDYMNVLELFQKQMKVENDSNMFIKHYLSWKILEDIIYNMSEEDLFPEKNVEDMIKKSAKSICSLYQQDVEFPEELQTIAKSMKKNIIEGKGGKGNSATLRPKKGHPFKARLGSYKSKRWVSIGKSKTMPDLDMSLFDPDTCKPLMKEINKIIYSVDSKIDAYCFIEKRKGPIGALMLASNIVNNTEKPAFIYRPRHLNPNCQFDGILPTEGDRICLIYDLARTGHGLYDAALAIENQFPVRVKEAFVFCDLKENASNFLKERDINLSSVYKMKSEEIKEIVVQERDRLEEYLNDISSGEKDGTIDDIKYIKTFLDLKYSSE